MGFTALSSLLFIIFLAAIAIAIWISRPGSKRSRFSLAAFAQTKPQAILLIAGVVLTVLAEAFRISLPPEARRVAWSFWLIGLLMFAVGAFYGSKKSLPAAISKRLQILGRWLHVTPAQALLLILSVLLVALAALAAGEALYMRAPFVALGAWALAIFAFVIGAWPLKAPRIRWGRDVIILVVALTLLAFALRGWDTNHIPNTLTGDEASGGLSAVEFEKSNVDNVFTFGWYSFPAFYFWLQAVSISAFGQTTAALRITSALAGALTVGAVYLAGRAMFGSRAGLYAAIFLSGLHLHLHFSRIGLNNVWDGLWFTVVIGLVWWAWKAERREGFLLAGLALGFSQYFYVSVRLLFVLVPFWLLLAGLADRARFRRNRASILLLFLAAIVIFLPLAVNYALHVNEFLAPMQRVSLLGPWLENEKAITGQPAWRILAGQLWLSVQSFTNTNLRHWYTPEVPILRPFAAGFFLLGVILLVMDWRKPQHWLLALWLGAFTLSGGLSESTPAAQRYIGVAPAAALVLGYALNNIAERLSAFWTRAKRLLAAAALVTVCLLALSDINFYFGHFTPRGEYSGTNTAIAQHLANYLQDKPAGTQVAFFGLPRMGYFSISSIAYLAPQIIGVDMSRPLGSPDNPHLQPGLVVFVFLPEHESDVEALLSGYPLAEVKKEFDMNGELLYWYVELFSYPNF